MESTHVGRLEAYQPLLKADIVMEAHVVSSALCSDIAHLIRASTEQTQRGPLDRKRPAEAV